MSARSEIECAGRKIGYARVSTKDQKLRMQHDALELAKCDKIFSDFGVSGSKVSRPGLDKLLKTLRRGDTVVVFKLDRLGRSVLHLSDMLVRFRNDGIHFCSITEGINTTTPGGKLVFHMFSAFAEFQREIILENTIAGIEAARRRGTHIGRPYRLNADAILEAHRKVIQDGYSKAYTARLLGVSPMTLDRAFTRMELDTTKDVQLGHDKVRGRCQVH